MQDINNNISHRDMKPYLVDPSPLLDTTFPVVSYDNNNVNTLGWSPSIFTAIEWDTLQCIGVNLVEQYTV